MMDQAAWDHVCVALTVGEPAGIGPEITAKALALLPNDPRFTNTSVRYFGDASLVPNTVTQPLIDAGRLHIAEVPCAVQPVAGVGDAANAAAVLDSIRAGVEACLSGAAHALVTNPINKAVLYQAGFAHPGHTEFLAALAGTAHPPVMMLSSDALNVVPITLHTSVSQAIADIRSRGPALIRHAVLTAADALATRLPTGRRPRLAVSGLNPHAGESGSMGREEVEIIAPTLAQLRAERSDLVLLGPLPADTMFDAGNRRKYDCALAMTHDQALIPVKTLAFDSAVNETLGLPFVRTSPDHGTAFDIAGQGIARPDSLLAALATAVQRVRAQRTARP